MDDTHWFATRHWVGDRADPERLAAARTASGSRVSVVVPGLNVAATVAGVLDGVRGWMGPGGLVDELVLMDSRSTDDTAVIAAECGARVVQDDEVLPRLPPLSGKGEAMWKSLAVTTGDLVVWLDGDIVGFDPAYVPGLLAPLLQEPAVGFVKAAYGRRLGEGLEGGRVTELCARPLLNLFWPHLAVVAQPLAGDQAGRRELLERLPFATGYGVEFGLLVGVDALAGRDAIAQVELADRAHINQDTVALGRMAFAITQTAMRHLERQGRVPPGLAGIGAFGRPERGADGWSLRSHEVRVDERPPMAEVRTAAP
ncbi:MAG: glucosyl-3-phosphoglycerate synthase [Thermoleophilia bacterium]